MADDEVNRPDITIENDIATWQIRTEGPILGTYAGTFKFRCYLTPSQTVAANRERREMLGENAILANDTDKFYALALTQLKYRIISGPPFWDANKDVNGYSGDIPDQEVLTMVLNAAVDAEGKFKQQLNKKKLDAVEKAKKAAEQILQQGKDDESQTEKNSDQP